MILHQSATTVNHMSDFVSPYIMGVFDAEEGNLCLPELYFTRQGDKCEFAEGWESVNGPSLLSLQVRGLANKYPNVLTDAEMAAELEDLVEGMDDNEFWSRGCW